MSKRKLTYEDFKRYFFNRQKPDEKHQFEKEMMQDAFEEEAFDGLSMLSEEELENDIQSLKNKINQRAQKRKRVIPLYFRYAAGIAILIGIGLTTLYIFNNSLKDNIHFTEPMHENMALSDEKKPDEEKMVQEQENEEVTASKSVEFDKPEATSKSEDIKPAKPKKVIDEIIVISDDAEEMDLDTEYKETEKMAEIVMEEEAEEEEPFLIAANEEPKQKAEKMSETVVTGAVQDKGVQAKGDKGNETNRSEKDRKLFGISRAKKSAGVTAEEAIAEDAAPQSQSINAQQLIEVAPPNNWAIDTLEVKLISEIKKRFDLANEIYKIDMELTVNTNGQVTQINHNKEIPENLQQTIQSVLNDFGPWKAAIENGQAVDKKVRIRFKLKP